MCGIAGILNTDGKPVSQVILQKMTDTLAHRGPDGEGFHIDQPVGLGHRRLAIIDLSPAGAQPMSTPDGRYIIAYNGMIYNFQELKTELAALGHRFLSHSDTEVLLCAWAQWGEAALDRLNGMFAFAVWDTSERVLTLARDRYGIKPMYYMIQGGRLLFASEIKAILAHPEYRPGVDKKALIEYFTFQNIFTDKTLFTDVRLLPPGSLLTIKPGVGVTGPPRKYWDYQFTDPETVKDEREYIEELERLFRQAVNRQLVADVPVGMYLSGGMDSGSITSVAAESMPYIKTFTVGFDLHSASGLEMGFDEREKAEHLSFLLKTEHYQMVLKAGDMERVMNRLVASLEDLRVGQSYPNYYAAYLASKFCKVVLSGAGGDELFGGYPWRYYRATVNSDFENYIDKYYMFWQRLIPNGLLRQVFKPVWTDVKDVWTRDIFKNVFNGHVSELRSPEDYINHSLYFEAKTFLHGLLVVEDRLSMAHGLETRAPFLDNDLVDFAMRIPVSMKLGNLSGVIQLNENIPGPKTERYYQQTHDGKMILRKAMERLLPRSVTERTKQGFSAPDASWFKGESIDYVRRALYDDNARLYEFLDRNAVRALVDEHMDGKTNRRLLIWSLLSFETWLATFG